MNYRFIFISLFAIFSFSCAPKPDYLDLSSYYFPFKTLEEGKIYEYAQIGRDSIDIEYLIYKSKNLDGRWILSGTFLDRAFNERQYYEHSIYENGTLIDTYSLVLMDSLGKKERIDATIKHPNGFPFQLKDSMAVLVTEMSWLFSEIPKHQTTIIRNRQYRGVENFMFQGKQVESISFNMKELVDDETIGHLETTYNGIEIYAKGIGLVYYQKEIGEEMDLQYQLKNIYPLSELNELSKRKNVE